MSIVVTKRLSLEFLGEEYKEGYLNLRSISLKEYSDLKGDIDKLEDDGDKALDYIKRLILDRFVSGSIPQGKETTEITKENIEDLPAEVFIEAMSVLSGKISPN